MNACWLNDAAIGQQSRVFVREGQTLTETELSAGSFLGEEFTLGADTVFEIESGGILGPISNPLVRTGIPFDFGGSTANIGAGGQLGGNNTLINEVSNLTINVLAGGNVTSSLTASSSTLNIEGGAVSFVRMSSDSSLNVSDGTFRGHVVDSTVNMSSGIGYSLPLYRSTAQISGGVIKGLELNDGSIANISGGAVRLSASSAESTLNLTGGSIDTNSGRTLGALNASGGLIGRRLVTARTTLIGGEFYLNGLPYTQPTLSFVEGEDAYFSGTLADGSPFVFSQGQRDALFNVQLVSATLPTNDTTAAVVDANSAPAPNGLRRGQSLTLGPGGMLNSTTAVVGAALSIEGGDVGNVVDVYQSDVYLREGSIGHNLHILPGSTFEVSGGTVGNFTVYSDSAANISGGYVARGIYARNGSSISITGGSIGDGFRNDAASEVRFAGGEFELNGLPYTGSTVSLSRNDTFSGTFEDGSPFIFHSNSDSLSNVQLIAATLPVIDLAPQVVSEPEDVSPTGLRAGQVLTLEGNGALRDNFEAVNATLNVSGGTVGDNLKLAGGEVNITGGQIGMEAEALHGSVVNLAGGTVGNRFHAASGSTVNVSGGSIGGGFLAETGSTVNLSGGTVGDYFVTSSGATFNLIGNEFMLNGAPYTDDTISNIDFYRATFSGTLADGTTFVFASRANDPRAYDRIGHANLVRTPLPEIDSAPLVVDGNTPSPNGLRPGQKLILESGGKLPENFVAIGSAMYMTGGEVGAGLQVVGSSLEISGGTIGHDMDVRSGTTMNVTGGTVEDLTSFFDSTVNVSGGRLGRLIASTDSLVGISGGDVSSLFLGSGSTVNFSGGGIGFISSWRGTLNLYVTEFQIDGVPSALEFGNPVRFRPEHSTLYSALLLDGSRFDFTGLNAGSGAVLSVTLIPEPDALALVAIPLLSYFLVRSRPIS